MSLDFSRKTDLAPLGMVVRDLRQAADALGAQFFLMGAAARDLMLLHAHGIETRRKTEDVDFAVMLQSWDAFAALRKALLDGDAFIARPGPATHRLRHKPTNLPLDIVPFGGIERADRTIAWPPSEDEVFDCFGVAESFEASIEVLLPAGVMVKVASIPALALLKITAWRDRKYRAPGRDAGDLALFMRHYMDCGNFDRAAKEHADLFAQDDYDHEATSAQLLGRDISNFLDHKSTAKILEILIPEADEDGAPLLAQQTGLELDHGRRLVGALCEGVAAGFANRQSGG